MSVVGINGCSGCYPLIPGDVDEVPRASSSNTVCDASYVSFSWCKCVLFGVVVSLFSLPRQPRMAGQHLRLRPLVQELSRRVAIGFTPSAPLRAEQWVVGTSSIVVRLVAAIGASAEPMIPRAGWTFTRPVILWSVVNTDKGTRATRSMAIAFQPHEGSGMHRNGIEATALSIFKRCSCCSFQLD